MLKKYTYYEKGQMGEVGKEIMEYCRVNGITRGTFAGRYGLDIGTLNRIIYKKQKRVYPELARKYAEIGYDLSKDFEVRARKYEPRVSFRLSEIGEERYRKIMEILGRVPRERV